MTEIKPITDEQLAELDLRYNQHDGNFGPSVKDPVIRMMLSEFTALRERLRLAESTIKAAEENYHDPDYRDCLLCKAVYAYRAATGKGDGG